MQEKGLEMLIHVFWEQKYSYAEKSIKDAVFPLILALGQIHFEHVNLM